jgi:hypothetical protein
MMEGRVDKEAEDWRDINPREYALLMHLLRGEFQGKAEIIDQMASVQVLRARPAAGLKLRTAGPAAIVKDSDAPSDRDDDHIVVEGFYDDEPSSDKSLFRVAKLVRLALHVIHGRVSELEIYREDGGQILLDPYEIDLSKVHFY